MAWRPRTPVEPSCSRSSSFWYRSTALGVRPWPATRSARACNTPARSVPGRSGKISSGRASDPRRIPALTPSENLLAVCGRRDAQLIAVLRHRPAGDLNPLAVQDPHQLAVGQRALGILGLDELLDLALDGQRRDVVAVLPVDAAVEEELHGEQAAVGMDVLVGDHPA